MSRLKLQFKDQAFQREAVEAVCDVFEGQGFSQRKYIVDRDGYNDQSQAELNLDGDQDVRYGWGNDQLRLNDLDLLKNIQAVQGRDNFIRTSHKLEKLTSEYEDLLTSQKQSVSRPVLTVEMETGTGKTYTYIKTIYELNRRYGWSKFIIVVPSIAIREGVLKTFQITTDHFKQQYAKACRFFVYDSNRLTDLRRFEDDPGINVMIINTQAFNARSNNRRINMDTLESFNSQRPIDVIAKASPIMIIDEPQSVLGEAKKSNMTRQNIGRFNPLFYINYSATHREDFNKVYRLDAIDAYQKKLVKKVAAKGIVVKRQAYATGYLYLQRINTYPNKSPSATVLFEYNTKTSSGTTRKLKTFAEGDDIYKHSGEVQAYKDGYLITNIDARTGIVKLSNGVELEVGQVIGNSDENDIRRIQIRETIASHLERERELFRRGIKVLSLFFIDEVAKYKSYDQAGDHQKGIYAEIFEEEYAKAVEKLKSQLPYEEESNYRKYLDDVIANQTHAGYFSIDKKGRAINSEIKRNETDSSDVDAYDLIMKDKERLLSFDEPVRFIFSHSALKEGWDNPNVFQICTLRESHKEIEKRQTIGRGLRLCVNKNGERMDGDYLGVDNVHSLNVLTVIANESYDEFSDNLQKETAQIMKNRPIKISQELFLDCVFKANDGQELKTDSGDASHVYVALEQAKLVKNNQLSPEYDSLSQEQRVEQLVTTLNQFGYEKLTPFAEAILQRAESVYDPSKLSLVENAMKDVKLSLVKDRYDSQRFKDLWQNINCKTSYQVQMDEVAFVDKCVKAINQHLSVTRTEIEIKTGYMSELMVMDGDVKTKTELLESSYSQNPVDLLGEVAKATNLTRTTIAKILRQINAQQFGLYKINPEGFIRGVVKLINEQKAITIVEHITYNKLEERWSAEEIFDNASIRGSYDKDVIDVKKHLFDRLKYDSQVEKKLAEGMDMATEVELYVKLPRSFYINTPMGNYNPDWAVVFKEDDVKHIYFVAETKGDDAALSLKGIEQAKIKCAMRHFETIADAKVKYSVIDSIDKLLELARQ